MSLRYTFPVNACRELSLISCYCTGVCNFNVFMWTVYPRAISHCTSLTLIFHISIPEYVTCFYPMSIELSTRYTSAQTPYRVCDTVCYPSSLIFLYTTNLISRAKLVWCRSHTAWGQIGLKTRARYWAPSARLWQKSQDPREELRQPARVWLQPG